MSLLELWSVLLSASIIKVVRDNNHEVLFEGESGYLPELLFPMRVCYVDIMDRQNVLYISVEELKGENNA